MCNEATTGNVKDLSGRILAGAHRGPGFPILHSLIPGTAFFLFLSLSLSFSFTLLQPPSFYFPRSVTFYRFQATSWPRNAQSAASLAA